jgi:hypothetical protein
MDTQSCKTRSPSAAMKADAKLVDVAAIPLSRPAAASSPQALADSVLTTEVVCVCVCMCVCVMQGSGC